jgi:hypothetical protein
VASTVKAAAKTENPLAAAKPENPLGCNSFAGTTPVLMADGHTKPIDQVKVGDTVANAAPDSPTVEAHTVTAIHIADADRDFADLTVDTLAGPKTITTTTAHHLFWDTTTHTWTDAQDLHPGDQLDTPGDGHATIVANHPYTTARRTYNLTIDTLHMYYVLAGTTPVLVHNAGCATVAKGAAGEARAVQELQDRGYDIVGQQISVRTSAANVRIDIVATRNGQTYFFDAKNGPYAGFTKNQGRLGGYNAISTVGGECYGPNAGLMPALRAVSARATST